MQVRGTKAVLVVAAVALLAGCAPGPSSAAGTAGGSAGRGYVSEAKDAKMRTTPPPWDAPFPVRPYIDAADMERLPFNFKGPQPYYVKIVVTVNGKNVPIPPQIGLDQEHAEQGSVHTHIQDADRGIVTVEGKTAKERPTLKQFFILWGVRYDENCLGSVCGKVEVLLDDAPTTWDTPLQREGMIQVKVTKS